VPNLGIDVGFGNVKAESETKKFDFPSVIGEFSPVKFSSGMEATEDPTTSLVIEYNSKKWFVGQSALKQSVPHNTIEQTRTVTEEGQVLLLSALGLLADKSSIVNLVVGLPVNHYSDLKENYIAQIRGTHNFNYLTLTGEVKDRKSITVRNSKVLPQPFGTIFDVALDDKGGLRDKKMVTGKIGVVDIGYNTLDLLRADGLQYINRRSTSFSEMGMFAAYRELAALLYHDFKVEISPEKLEPIVQRGFLSYCGRIQPIESHKQEAFRAAAEAIISKIKSIWPDSWELDKIIFTGGGAIHLGDYLVEKYLEQSMVSDDPLYSNVNGYRKCAQFTWGD
jgi:plasmid segregation protein ParM